MRRADRYACGPQLIRGLGARAEPGRQRQGWVETAGTPQGDTTRSASPAAAHPTERGAAPKSPGWSGGAECATVRA